MFNIFKRPIENKELPWIAEIKTVFGYHEVRDSTKLKQWLRSDGKTLGDPKALPWCGDAVETAIKNSLPNEPFTGKMAENPYWARNWLHFGKSITPCYGAVLVFSRESGGHVGFAVGQDADAYYVLGGNQGNTVSIVRIDKNRLLGARWPLTHPTTSGKLPTMAPGNIPKSTNEF